MKDTEVIDLVGELLAKDSHNIYICGPSYGDNHLRVYAYGGLLCKLPTGRRAEISLLNEKLKFAFGRWRLW